VAPTQPKPTAIWNSARDVWETPQTEGLFCEHLDVYSETFPTSGSMRSGEVYALPTWAPPTADTGSSSSPDDGLLGTPTSRMWKGAGPSGGPTQIRNKARGLIEAQVMDIPTVLLPTVTTSESTGPGNGPKKTGGDNLRTVVALLPTPTAQQDGSVADLAKRELRVAAAKEKHGRIFGKTLDVAVALLPSPRASEGEKGGPNMRGSKGDLMLSSAVHRLTGETTDPPSGGGKLDSDGQLRGQLNLLDAMGDSA